MLLGEQELKPTKVLFVKNYVHFSCCIQFCVSLNICYITTLIFKFLLISHSLKLIIISIHYICFEISCKYFC